VFFVVIILNSGVICVATGALADVEWQFFLGELLWG